MNDSASVTVVLELRGGHHQRISLTAGSPLLAQLKRLHGGAKTTPGLAPDSLLQLPLDAHRAALSFNAADILRVSFLNAGEHPAMNVSEGHLGGYISARHPRSAELGMTHGDAATWTPALWRWIKEELGVSSVLDVGCGEGHAAGFFRKLGCRVCGVDGSALALRDSVIPEDHRQYDYTSGPYVPVEGYDMVWSCEFVEHVEEIYAEHFLATFGCANKYIFMTAAPPGQPGWHHVNCQLPAYWIEKVEKLGFTFERHLTKAAREIAEAGHFAGTGMVFMRRQTHGG